jgi:oligopeptide transport system substrate-binding protein
MPGMAHGTPSQRLRQIVPVLLLTGLLAGAIWLASSARLDKADFTFNNASEVTTLDPATVTGVPEGRIIKALYEGLVVWHPRTLAPVPGMAESWEISDDRLTYTFHIREALWSNNDPVTAHDFVYSMERFLNPGTGAEYAYQLWYVKGARAYTEEVTDDGKPANSFDTVAIRADDDRTLVVELESPTPFFLFLMGFYPLAPVNARNIAEAKVKWPDTWEIQYLKPANLVTNGPYTVDYRRVNDRIRLRKSETYWDRDNVAFETIDALAIERVGTGLNVYLTGECGWITAVPVDVLTRLLPREDFNPTPYLGTYFYRVNVTRPPFDDMRVRQALSLTIDRQAVCEKITKAGEFPSYTLCPPAFEGYTTAECAQENTEEAKRLLAEAGYGPGGKEMPTVEVLYNTREDHKSIAEVIAAGWARELGMKVKLLNQEWKVYLDSQSTLQYDICRAAWIGDYSDPNTFLDMFVTNGENNKTGWGNPEYDRLVAAAAREFDPAQRMEILRQAERILMDELPILPIYTYVTKNMVAPRLGGFYDNVQDQHFPKYWYYMDDEELAEKRAAQPGDWTQVDAIGPSEGIYSPNEMKRRAGL